MLFTYHTKSLIFQGGKSEKSTILILVYYRNMMIFDTLGVSEAIFGQPTTWKTSPEYRTNNYEYANDIKHGVQSP